MGINGIWEHMTKHAKNVSLDCLRNKTLAVDGHIWLYESLKGSAHYRHEASYLVTFFQRCQRLREQKIEPFIVFDCFSRPPPAMNDSSWEERKKNKCCVFLEHPNSITVAIESITTLLDNMGIRWLEAKMDGEAQCAFLERLGITDGCITPDFDYFLFGGTNLYKVSFDTGGRAVDDIIKHVSMDSLRDEYHLTLTRLIAIAMLLGCDYYKEGVGKAGFITALEIISEFTEVGQAGEDDDVVMILDRFASYCRKELPERDYDSETKKKLRKKKFEFPVGFPNTDSVINAVRIYMLPAVMNYSMSILKPEKNMEEVKKILTEQCGWSPMRFDSEMKKNEKKTAKVANVLKQPKITKFFAATRQKLVESEMVLNGSRRENAAMNNLKRKSLESETNSSMSISPKRSAKILIPDVIELC